MIRRLPLLAWIVTLLAIAAVSRASEVLDRIVATVNKSIILQSDWDDAVSYEAFTAGRPLDQLTAEDRKSALDRLIDQELLREQIGSAEFPHSTDQEVAKRIEDIRKQFAGADTEEGWHAVLARYGLTEKEVKRRVALELDLMRLVDVRLRPTVSIDSKSIESYYNQELLPQLRQSGAKEVPLAEVSPRIKELLTQEKVSQLLATWLHTLRAGSEIHTATFATDSGGQPR